MKKKLFCLGLCILMAAAFTGCDDDLFKLQGGIDESSAVTTDENGYQSYKQKISSKEKPEITNIYITAICEENIENAVSVRTEQNVLISDTVGLIGEPMEIRFIDNELQDTTLTFTYDPDELRGIPEKNITPMYIDYDENIFRLIYDFKLNEDENKISFPITQSGTYLLLDIYQYGTAMGMEVSQYAYKRDKTAYPSDWERKNDTGDIIKLADKKWTVENAPTFHVSTPEQLASVVYYVNAINEQPVEIYLESDLDLSKYEWKPMGWSTTYGANLIFHGQNHTINGLNINCHNKQNVGFTGYAWNIVMDNVNFTNANITGGQYVGGFSGQCYGTKKFTNVSLSGTIYGDDGKTGGFIGSGANGIYTDCKLDINVNGKPYYFFSSSEQFNTENIDETAFTLSVNENNRVQRTENDKYDRIDWTIYDGDTHLMSRGAENETEIPDSLWEYLHAEKGKTYTVYMRGYKKNSDGTSGYTRVSNIIQYIY